MSALMHLDTPGLAMSYGLVPWDCAIFGFPVAHIATLEVRDAVRARADLAAFEAWREAQDVRLVSFRCERAATLAWMLLEDAGFRFIEMVHHPRFDGVRALPAHETDITIAPAQDADMPALEAIASAAFKTGRYALDPRLPPDLNGRRYAAWVRNAMADPAQEVLACRRGNDLVAFFVVARSGDEARWHLTAVAPEWQGQGVGRRVWQAMLERHRAEGLARVRTVVSAHNLPVLNLYASLRFVLERAEVTLHWVRAGMHRS